MRELVLLLLIGHSARAEYVWPGRYDKLEDLLAMNGGYRRFGFTDLVVPCGFGSNTVGKQNAAEWIRTGFHDMATHDKSSGTGGLDASIMYELERGENLGSAFNSTLGQLREFVTPRTSAADLIALGVVASVASCGGGNIPLRGGRIDATEAGPVGVPEPQDSLDTISADFERMGFNTEEMITMVACGHTLGGVHSVDFPDVTEGEVSDSNVQKFDSTHAAFDKVVVDEYLANEGTNPLVFGANETKNSDKRVFGADKNATMTKLSDATTFSSSCVDILERMINTVPSKVQLSEPIDLVDVKPYIDTFDFAEDSASLSLEGSIRIRSTPGKGHDDTETTVAINLEDRNGQRTMIQAARATYKGGISYGFWGETFTWYTFTKKIDPSSGIKGFDIHITTGAGVESLDNGGTGGYPVQDEVILARKQSCVDYSKASEGNVTFNLVAGVREDLVNKLDEAPWVDFAHEIQQQGIMIPRLSVERVAMKESSSAKGGYKFYKVAISTDTAGWSTVFDLGITVGGVDTISISNSEPDSC